MLFNDSGACHLIIGSVPDSKLAGCDAALRLVKDDIEARCALYEPSLLQGLPVAYTHAVAAYLTVLHFQVGADPVDLAAGNLEAAARQSGMGMPLTGIDGIGLNIGGNHKK